MYLKSLSLTAIAIIGICIFTGCGRTEEEHSAELTEPAKVVQLVFTPSIHDSSLSPGMTMNGKLTLSYSSVDVPEKYAVVFECQHGKFIIEGDKGKALWQRLHNNEDVTVHYREIYVARYDGDDHLIERRLHKYDFLDAIPVPATQSTTQR